MGRGILAASHGIQQAISTPAPPKTTADRAPIYHKLDWAGHQALMAAMGQDGSEGQDYVNTSQAYIVNRFLRNGGDMADAHKATPNWSWITRADVQRTIRRMDGQMRPLPRNIEGVRFVGPDFLRLLGMSPTVSAAAVKHVQQRIQAGKDTFSDNAYTSFSTDTSANVFTAKAIRLNYKISKGTKAIMTANKTESEGVLARGTKQRMTGVRWKHGKLEIDITV
jgi:hypothetical protein